MTAEELLRQAMDEQKAGRLAEAERLYGLVLERRPRDHNALANLGGVFLMSGRLAEGLQAIDASLAVKPDQPDVLRNKAGVLQAVGRADEAAAVLRQAAFHKTAQLRRLEDLAETEMGQGRLAQALEAADRALALNPDSLRAHLVRGVVLRTWDRTQEAHVAFQRAVALAPDQVAGWNALGITAVDQGFYQEGLDAFDRALACAPGQPQATWNKASLLMLMGRLDEGWPYMESRWLQSEMTYQVRDPGRILMLRSEQGLGDTLQFCRYASLAADRGATVILGVQRPLVTLLSALRGVSQVVANDDPQQPAFDLHCPMMSLPLAFGGAIPQPPYLAADPAKAEVWRERLGERTRPRVGLVWAGAPISGHAEASGVNELRNIRLELLAPLAAADVDFFSLQKGAAAEAELKDLAARGWAGPGIVDLTQHIHDFSDTAALVEQLDLVISVDTSTAHLAGAMGKPVWLLNRFDTCWRWMLERTDSPWYPTLRLFRQRTFGDWPPVVDDLAEALKAVSGR